MFLQKHGKCWSLVVAVVVVVAADNGISNFESKKCTSNDFWQYKKVGKKLKH